MAFYSPSEKENKYPKFKISGMLHAKLTALFQNTITFKFEVNKDND